MFDQQTIIHVLQVSLLGGLIGLDRTALGQFMISQPIVAASLTGWFLGDAVTGLIIGGILELIWVLDMPIGTFVPADSTVFAVSATGIAVLGAGEPGNVPVMGFSLLLTVIMAPATMYADQLMRQRNAKIPELVLGSTGLPTEASATGWHLAGLIAFLLKSFMLCLGLVTCGLVAVKWFIGLPPFLHRAMMLFITFLPLLGVASVSRKLSFTTVDRTLVIGFCVGAVAVQLLHIPVLAAILLAVASGWLGERIDGR
ncbi:MAG: PTS sugar transporter subunit IIC [Nitrospirota bacterium]|nr:PTS sugar transporter subunit IIC [Nitrospirota bacterium]